MDVTIKLLTAAIRLRPFVYEADPRKAWRFCKGTPIYSTKWRQGKNPRKPKVSVDLNSCCINDDICRNSRSQAGTAKRLNFVRPREKRRRLQLVFFCNNNNNSLITLAFYSLHRVYRSQRCNTFYISTYHPSACLSVCLSFSPSDHITQERTSFCCLVVDLWRTWSGEPRVLNINTRMTTSTEVGD